MVIKTIQFQSKQQKKTAWNNNNKKTKRCLYFEVSERVGKSFCRMKFDLPSKRECVMDFRGTGQHLALVYIVITFHSSTRFSFGDNQFETSLSSSPCVCVCATQMEKMIMLRKKKGFERKWNNKLSLSG